MYEDQANEKDGTHNSEKDRVLAWTKDVADSTADKAPRVTAQAPHSEARHGEREPPRVVVNQIVTTPAPAVVVTRIRPEPTSKDEISTKAVIGTLLGATAGAVVAYAITKSTENPEEQNRVAYRTTDAPITYELVQADNDSHVREYSQVNSKSSHRAIAAPPLPRPHIDDLIPRSEQSHHSSRSIIRSHVEDVTSTPTVTKNSVADSRNSKISHASSHGRTVRQPDLMPVTEGRSAKDVPLPHSRVTSLATEEKAETKAGKSSVFPKDSVSQVSTRRSGESGRSRNHGSRNSGSGKDREHGGSHRSRTLKR